MLTGHGCFGQFLFRIGKERTPECHHCRAECDSAQHTLAECEAWEVDRAALTHEIGPDLALPTVVSRILEREDAWVAFSRFCEKVMLRKEDSERERRGEGPRAARRGRRRRGRAMPRRRNGHTQAVPDLELEDRVPRQRMTKEAEDNTWQGRRMCKPRSSLPH